MLQRRSLNIEGELIERHQLSDNINRFWVPDHIANTTGEFFEQGGHDASIKLRDLRQANRFELSDEFGRTIVARNQRIAVAIDRRTGGEQLAQWAEMATVAVMLPSARGMSQMSRGSRALDPCKKINPEAPNERDRIFLTRVPRSRLPRHLRQFQISSLSTSASLTVKVRFFLVLPNDPAVSRQDFEQPFSDGQFTEMVRPVVAGHAASSGPRASREATSEDVRRRQALD